MKIFVNPSGQRENLGDSVLRRGYLDALREHGELHVLTGSDTRYISGLGIRDSDVTYQSKRTWLRSVLVNSLRSRTHFAANAGEIVTGKNFFATFLWQSAIAAALRFRNGRVVMMGAANREHPSSSRGLLRVFLRQCHMVTWRDEQALASFGIGEAQPDWAVGLVGSGREVAERRGVVLSLRGDRPYPSDRWCSAFAKALELMGSPPLTVVVQVDRDSARAAALAERFGGAIVDWPVDRNHAEHERVVRSVYSGAECVISDRIHALIIGFTEGAVPIGYSPGDERKLVKTFETISPNSLMWSSETPGGSADSDALLIYEACAKRGVLLAELDESKERLRAISATLDGVLN